MKPSTFRATPAMVACLLLPGSAAWGGSIAGTDPSGDVHLVRDWDATAEHTSRIDITAYGAEAGTDLTRFWIDLVDADPRHPANYSWSLEHTGDGNSDLAVYIDPTRDHAHLGRITSDSNGHPIAYEHLDCSVRGWVDAGIGRAIAELPSNCLDEAGQSFTMRMQSAYKDESGGSWIDHAPTDEWDTYSEPVLREPSSDTARPTARARRTDDSCPEGQFPHDRFEDTSASVHQAAIDCVAWWGVTGGDGSGGYGPSRAVTRAQMATFITRVLDQTVRPLPENAEDRFSDDRGNPHEENINRLASVGIVSGDASGRFRPESPVSRAQMATFIVRAYDYVARTESSTTNDYFADDDGDPHEGNINVAADLGVTGGSAAGYSPRHTVRRDQMASFLARTLDVLIEEGVLAPPS